jgi:hypothetical protein
MATATLLSSLLTMAAVAGPKQKGMDSMINADLAKASSMNIPPEIVRHHPESP